MLIISYNPGYQSVLKDLKTSTRQRFVSLSFAYPEQDLETKIVAAEAGIDMELATLFSVAYRYAVPIGSIMLVSDMPLQIDGVKDKKKQDQIFSKYTATHLDLAVDAVKNMEAKWDEVKRRLTSEW